MSERFRAGFIHPSVAAEFENSLILGMNRFRPDQSHVAQQSRRDKLRVQQTPVAGPTHLATFPRGSEPDPDLIQVRDDSNFNDRVMLSSGTMLDFSSNAHDPSGVSEASHDDSSSQCPSFGSHLPSTSKPGYQNQNFGFWKGMNSQSQPTCDWIMNYVNGGAVQIPLFASQLYQKSGFSGFQGVQTPLNNLNNPSSELSSDHSQRQYMELPFSSPQFCQNTLQEVVTPSSSAVANQGLELASGSWDSGGNELHLLRSHEEQTNGAPGIHNPTPWTSGQIHQWSIDGGFVGIKTGVSDNATKGLALSLSSNPPPDLQVAKFDGRFGEGDLPSNISIDPNSKANKGGFRCSKSSLSCGSKGSVGSVGPLGPFTGYATILKSSKFLKPAQNLLDEFCGVMAGPRLARSPEPPERIRLGEATRSTCGTVGANNEVSMRGSSSSLYTSIQASGEWVTGSGASQVIHGPEFQQKKAKLMFMQEEVCRRYKQYHQQMQMVVSSFESVAGLSTATPYTSLALKAIWKHFRCLKNAISEQLRHITKVLGGNCISSPGSNLGETLTTPRLKFLDRALQKHKVGENGLGFLDRNQPVWRPQRGLPERSVAVLRAWLFEHFLHPYPTDTDKHMLASQTSLSRNQVSNWFINARVRLWKPMVEEIHMLETKGLMEVDLNSSKDDGKPAPDISERPESYRHYQANKLPYCSSAGATTNNLEYQQDEEEHQEKRLRMEECPISDAMDGGLLFGFSPYQHGFDMGGLGAVSLTLGLRHNEGAAYQQQQQMRRHFGDHMSHDFMLRSKH